MRAPRLGPRLKPWPGFAFALGLAPLVSELLALLLVLVGLLLVGLLVIVGLLVVVVGLLALVGLVLALVLAPGPLRSGLELEFDLDLELGLEFDLDLELELEFDLDLELELEFDLELELALVSFVLGWGSPAPVVVHVWV